MISQLFELCDRINKKIKKIRRNILKTKFGFCGKDVIIQFEKVINPDHIYMYDNTNIFEGFTFINNKGKFIIKENSGAAQGLTVITDTHTRKVGRLYKDPELFFDRQGDLSADVIVEEDVWIGANVTLLPGVIIGRGATIGAGSVVNVEVPPYAVVVGNPAKIVGFNYTPTELLEHEISLYSKDNLTPIDKYEKRFNKKYVNRTKEIMNYLKL